MLMLIFHPTNAMIMALFKQCFKARVWAFKAGRSRKKASDKI
jgi:hypothetical protein